MGNVSGYMRSISSRPATTKRIMLLGWYGSGRTTILYRLVTGNLVETIPTIGFNIENIKNDKNSAIFEVWDLGGRDKMRGLWRHYFPNTKAIIYVMDSTIPKDQIHYVISDLTLYLNDPNLKGRPMLILANKQDLKEARSPQQILEELDLDARMDLRFWTVIGCSALDGTGLEEGMNWVDKVLAHVETLEQGSGFNRSKQPELGDDEDTAAGSDSDDDEIPDSRNSEHLKKHSTLEEVTATLGYHPRSENDTLLLFAPIQRNIQCPFAKAAKLWGSRPFSANQNLTLHDHAKRNVEALTEFCKQVEAGAKYDGFCFHLNDPDSTYGSPEDLGNSVRTVLDIWSNLDPAGDNVMKSPERVGMRGWRFRFASVDFFLTTFAPCYPRTSSRYAFGTGCAFLLLQPEVSFHRHKGVGMDTPHTNWREPRTARDKTRIAFAEAGRSYYIPPTTKYPPAEHIVKPLVDDGSSVVKWWLQERKPEERDAGGVR